MHIKGIKQFFSKNKKATAALLLLTLGLALALIFSGGEKSAEKGSLEEYKSELEEELEKLCSSVSGVGKCKVTVSFSSGEESVYKNGKLQETKPPKILGVAVACRGADSTKVRRELTELFTALYDIPSNRVAILKLN